MQKQEQGKPTTYTEHKNQQNRTAAAPDAKTDDQATLASPSRRDPSPWDDVEGIFGISTLGTSCHGPRTLLEVTKEGRKSELKVAHSTD